MDIYTTRREEIWARRHYTLADREVMQVVNVNAARPAAQGQQKQKPAPQKKAPRRFRVRLRTAWHGLQSLEAFGIALGVCTMKAVLLAQAGSYRAALAVEIAGLTVYILGG